LTVELNRKDHHIHLHIIDDGQGFDRLNSNGGNGLKNMEYRAKNISARIQIESIPRQGTKIILIAPIT
jgi:signal transduction histidine kinase